MTAPVATVRLTLFERAEGILARQVMQLPPTWIARLLGARRRVMRGEVLDPTVQLALSLAEWTGRTAMHQLPVAAARAEFEKMVPIADLPPRPLLQVSDREIAGPGGPLTLRTYRPCPGTVPALVFAHGGGFVLGSLSSHDRPLRELAHLSGCVIIAIDYRLAPEHPFPAALEDARAALSWVQSNATLLGVDPDRIALGGDSAGGNLTAAVCHELRRLRQPLPVAQLLIYPAVDLHNLSPSRLEYQRGYFLDKALIDWFVAAYAQQGVTTADPRLSPLLYGDFSGQPPALLLTAGFDPLQDEGVAYVTKLRDAGCAVEHLHFPNQIHGLFGMGGVVADGRRAIAACAEFLRRTLQVPDSGQAA